jgi:hypothetical protein
MNSFTVIHERKLISILLNVVPIKFIYASKSTANSVKTSGINECWHRPPVALVESREREREGNRRRERRNQIHLNKILKGVVNIFLNFIFLCLSI